MQKVLRTMHECMTCNAQNGREWWIS